MKQGVKLGVVCLTRHTFDFNAAAELYEGIKKDLNKIENLEVCAVEKIIMTQDEAIEAGKFFASNLVDAIAVISGTFHLGHLVLEIKKICDKPLLLWGLPELPYNGGKIRLNSVCGVNLNGSNLTKAGYSDFTYTVSSKIDENWLDAIRMMVALKNASVGIIGYRADGFFNVGIDELATYKKFGCLVNHYELNEIWGYKESADSVAYYEEKVKKIFNLKAVTEEQVKKVCTLASKLKNFMTDKNIKIMAIRCWPEFAAGFGISPCAAMSLLQDEGYILACEGDIDCGLTMLCHQAAGAETPFMADLSQVNLEEGTALMWHDGVAACSLCDGVCTPTLDTYFAGGKGVTAGFVMKSGAMNMARLDSINGTYRLFQEKGTALPMEKILAGTYAKVKFEHPMKDVLDRVIYTGVAHHVSMVYGDFSKTFEIFAKLLGIEML